MSENTKPNTWPAEAFAMKQSSDMRTSIVGALLFAQWEHRLSGWHMSIWQPGSIGWISAGDAQRRTYRVMEMARLALVALDAA